MKTKPWFYQLADQSNIGMQDVFQLDMEFIEGMIQIDLDANSFFNPCDRHKLFCL